MIVVEVDPQADLLDNDDKKVEELVKNLSSRLLQPELVTLAGLFGRFPGVWSRKTVIAKEIIQTGLVNKENLERWVHHAQHAHVNFLQGRSSRRYGACCGWTRRGLWLGVERCFVGMMSESMARRHDLHLHGGCEDSTPN